MQARFRERASAMIHIGSLLQFSDGILGARVGNPDSFGCLSDGEAFRAHH